MRIIYYNDYKKTDKYKDLEGDEDNIFEEFYKMNNTLRYCNGSHWNFEDSKNQDKYVEWVRSLDENRHFNLYYGNGVVD